MLVGVVRLNGNDIVPIDQRLAEQRGAMDDGSRTVGASKPHDTVVLEVGEHLVGKHVQHFAVSGAGGRVAAGLNLLCVAVCTRQWRTFLNAQSISPENERDYYFQEFFADAAAQCDAVILTSPALAESDLRCCPRASTEELVGKLMRHLGCALLTPEVLEQIVGKGENRIRRKPRLFALAGLALETMDDYYMHFDLMMRRQAELVRGSFGDGIPDQRFLLVATTAEDVDSDLVDEMRRAAGGSFFTATTPAYVVEKRDCPILNLLHMITLWPFEFNEDKLRPA